MLRADAFDVG